MSVMKTFCGCMSTKSGTLTIIGLGILIYITGIVFASLRLEEGAKGWVNDQIEIPTECKPAVGSVSAGEDADAWWCKAIVDMQDVEKDVAIVKICVNSVLLVASLIGLYAAAMSKACLLLPYIILEFLQLLGFGACIILTVMVMAVYSPGDVEISTTISIGVIGVIVMVILFYLWLCAVSLYQSLKEIQNMGSDQVKIMQFQEDPPYNKFDTAPHSTNAGYDPHMDDYQTLGGAEDPPSYRPPSSPRPPVEDAKIEDIVE